MVREALIVHGRRWSRVSIASKRYPMMGESAALTNCSESSSRNVSAAASGAAAATVFAVLKPELHTHTQTQTQTHRHTDTQTHRHTDTHTNAYSPTHTARNTMVLRACTCRSPCACHAANSVATC